MIKQRIKWIDIAKGITIILTIIGHTVVGGRGELLRGMIYSFHMPLFFTLSCITYSYSSTYSEWGGKLLKSAKHLLLPAFFIIAIRTVIQCSKTHSLIWSLTFWESKLISVLFASGVNTSYASKDVIAIGLPWFFFALFFARGLFDYLQLSFNNRNQLLSIVVIFGLIGVLFGKNTWLLLSLDIVFAVMPFCYLGFYCKKFTYINPFPLVFISCITWLASLYIEFPLLEKRTYLELASRTYGLFPLSYFTAVMGIVFMACCSVLLERLIVSSIFLQYIGKNSLYLLCVHALDNNWGHLWESDRQMFSIGKRVIIDLVVFLCVTIIVEIYRTRRKQ